MESALSACALVLSQKWLENSASLLAAFPQAADPYRLSTAGRSKRAVARFKGLGAGPPLLAEAGSRTVE